MRAVWPDSVVEENNLNQHIAALRSALQYSRCTNLLILTVPCLCFLFFAYVYESIRCLFLAHPFTLSLSCPSTTSVPIHLSLIPRLCIYRVNYRCSLSSLSRSSAVISLTSVMSYKHTNHTAARIGHEFCATYLIEGSLRAEAFGYESPRRWFARAITSSSGLPRSTASRAACSTSSASSPAPSRSRSASQLEPRRVAAMELRQPQKPRLSILICAVCISGIN